MSDILSTISNFLTASWRAGAAFFLVGLSVYLSKRYDIAPLSELDQQWYQGAILAGILGLAFLMIHGLVLIGQGISFIVPRFWQLILSPQVRKRERELAEEKARKRIERSIKNWDALTDNQRDCLIWIKRYGSQRFKAPRRSELLNELFEADVLDRDISEREKVSREIHWIVPNHIWSKLEGLDSKRLRSRYNPQLPPW